LYYLRTETSQRAENVSQKVARDALKDFETQTMKHSHKTNVLRVKDKKMKVEIYSKSNCPFCEKAKHGLIQHGYEYTEIQNG
jgi:hypothetical protein